MATIWAHLRTMFDNISGYFNKLRSIHLTITKQSSKPDDDLLKKLSHHVYILLQTFLGIVIYTFAILSKYIIVIQSILLFVMLYPALSGIYTNKISLVDVFAVQLYVFITIAYVIVSVSIISSLYFQFDKLNN